MARETVLLEIEINEAGVSQKLGQVAKNLDELKIRKQDLRKQLKEGVADWAKVNAELAQNQNEIKMTTQTQKALQGQLIQLTKVNEVYGDSLNEQRRKLGDLKMQYAELSKAERESAGGQEMLKSLGDLDKQVKQTEASMGVFGRNVGNYPKLLNLSASSIEKLAVTMNGLGGGFKAAGTVAKSAFSGIITSAKAMGMAFLTPPVIVITAILTAIILVIKGISNAFKGNEEATNRVKAAFAAFQPILNIISNLFTALANGISKAVEWLVKWIPAASKAASETTKLAVAKQELIKAERVYTEETAKNERDISELRAKARKKEKYSAEERKAMLEEAQKLSLQNMENEKKIAAEKLRILEKEVSMTKSVSQEQKDNLSKMRAEMYRIEQNYFEGTTKLNKQHRDAVKEINDEAVNAAKEQKERRDKAAKEIENKAKKALEIARQLEDELTKLYKKGTEFEIEQVRIASRRRIEELEERLRKEKDLTVEAQKNIEALIAAIRQQAAQQEIDIQQEAFQKIQQDSIDSEIRKIELLLSVQRKGSEAELDLRIQMISAIRERELLEADKLGLDKNLIREKYDIQFAEARKDKIAKDEKEVSQIIQNELEKRLIDIGDNEVEKTRIELESAEAKYARLAEMDENTIAAMFENQAEYEAAMIAATKNIISAQKAAQDAIQKTIQNTLSNLKAMHGAISGIFNSMGEMGEEYAGFKHALALAEIAINTATAISAAVAAATPGDPYTVAIRIAAAVAAAIASTVAATTQLNKADIPNAPKFAQGGIVQGNNIYGDRVPIMANSREMVLTQEQQANLFDGITAGAFGNGFNYDLIGEKFEDAVSKIQVIMDYSEKELFERNRLKFKEKARI